MPSPRLDDANIEFTFAPEEILAAKFLDPLKIQWLQTLYAQTWKQKAATPAPENPADDRMYFLRMAELDGKMAMLQQLMDDHKEALKSFNEAKLSVTREAGGAGASDMQAIAHSAASMVHG